MSSDHRGTSAKADVIVVGAGIAGLVAAWELRDLNVVLLEASDRVGGRIRSEPRDPYWLNLAAHVFPPPGTTLDRVLREVGLATEPIPGSTLAAFMGRRLVSPRSALLFPLLLPMSLSGRVSLARAGLRIRSAVEEYLALARRQPDETGRAVRARLLAYRDDLTFAAFLGPLDPQVDSLLRAAVNRVAAEPEELAAGAGVAQFAATFSGSRSQFHATLSGGSQRLPDALALALAGRIRLGATVTRVVNRPDHVEVSYRAEGEEHVVSGSAAVLAMPADVTSAVLNDAPQPLRAALESIVYGPYVAAAILTDERRRMPWDDVYAVVVPGRSFNMLFNIASLLRRSSVRAPGGSLMIYGASRLGRELLALTDEQIRHRFLKDLAELFPQTRGHVSEVLIQRWEQGIPHSRPGRHLHQAALEQPFGNVFLAGDYIGQRGGMDTAAEVAADAARDLRASLDARRTGASPGV